MESDVTHRLSGGAAGLAALLDAIESQLADAQAPDAVVASVLIACDEIVSNILNHGGGDPAVEVAVRVHGGGVSVAVVDDAPAFDPTRRNPPDTGLPLEARQIGGLGIHMVRKMMDQVSYERVGGRNRLQFTKTFPAAAS
jgi:serine/threonine-protein kinase RsbW